MMATSDTGTTTVVRVIPPCDFCNGSVLAVVDGKTRIGPWANMCQRHFDLVGVGLGTGKGQRFVLKEGASDGQA